MGCVLLHLHLVSCGLCSWIYLLIFPYHSEIRVDTNAELIVLCVTLMFVAWHCVWHRLYPSPMFHHSNVQFKVQYPCTILPPSPVQGDFWKYYVRSIHVLCLRDPMLFSSALIKTISLTSIFISFVLCIMLCLSRRERSFFPTFTCCLFINVDITLAFFHFWSIFI